MITPLDAHETVKDLTSSGFTESQAEALTSALTRVQAIDLSEFVTQADLAREIARLDAAIAALGTQLRGEMEILQRDLTIRLGGMIVVAHRHPARRQIPRLTGPALANYSDSARGSHSERAGT